MNNLFPDLSNKIDVLQNFATKDLISLLKILRAKYAIYKSVNKDVQDEEAINFYLIIKGLLSDRNAFQATDDILDKESQEFQKFASHSISVLPDEAITVSTPETSIFGEPYAPVLPSGTVTGDPLSIDSIRPNLKSFLAASPIAWLVGGIVEHSSVSNDVDILISTPSKEELEKIIKFRLSRSFPVEIRDRIHLLCEQKGYLGPFTNCLPLYRLLVERIPNQDIIKMAEINLRVKDSAKYKAQAERALEKDFITVGEFYLPVKPIRGYLPGKLQTLDLFLDLYDEHYSYPALSSKKYDGMRILIHKDGDKITIFSEDGKLQTMLPKLKEEIKGLKPKKCVLEAELERWNYLIGQHLPRETVNPDVEDDSELTSNVFECLVFEGLIPKELNEELKIFDSNPEDWKSKFVNSHSDTFSEPSIKVDLQVHKYPSLIRFKFLELLGIDQKTVKEPKADHRLNLVPHFRCDSRKKLKEKTEDLRFIAGSEGNVVSAGIVKYHLTSGARPYQMLKFHNSVSFIAIAIRSIETKTKGIFTIEYGIPAGDKPIKFADTLNDTSNLWINPFSKDPGSAWQDPSQPTVYPVGKTFTTTEKAPPGSSIQIECETLNVVRVEDKVIVSAWSPRFIDLKPNLSPDFLSDVIDKANFYHVAQFKIAITNDRTLVDPSDQALRYLKIADRSNKILTYYFFNNTKDWSSSGSWTVSSHPFAPSPYKEPKPLSPDSTPEELKEFIKKQKKQSKQVEKELEIILPKLKSSQTKKEQFEQELIDWGTKLQKDAWKEYYAQKLKQESSAFAKEVKDYHFGLAPNPWSSILGPLATSKGVLDRLNSKEFIDYCNSTKDSKDLEKSITGIAKLTDILNKKLSHILTPEISPKDFPSQKIDFTLPLSEFQAAKINHEIEEYLKMQDSVLKKINSHVNLRQTFWSLAEPPQDSSYHGLIMDQLKSLLKKLTIATSSFESLSKDDSQKLLEEIIKIKSQILFLLIDNNLESIEVDDLVLSPRKVPTTFEIENEKHLIEDLKDRKLERFISVKEEVQLEELKKFLLSPEITNSTDFKLPHGIKKTDDHYSLYMFTKYSEDILDDFQIFYFYEIPYYPQKESNAQLADAWRLMCAHYATWKNTSGAGITFTKDQIVDNAIKAVKEIKERISKKEMVHIFEPNKMQDSSKELYELAKKALPDDFKDIGELPPVTEFGGPGSGFFDHQGRPGIVGGSLPSSSNQTTQSTTSLSKISVQEKSNSNEADNKIESTTNSILKSIQSRIISDPLESGTLIDSEGNEIASFTGVEDSIQLDISPEQADESILIHNHPTGSSFSPADIFNAVSLSLKESIVVGILNDKKVSYSIKPDYDFLNLSALDVINIIKDQLKDSERLILVENVRLISNDKISQTQAQQSYWDNVWKDVAIKILKKGVSLNYKVKNL